MGRCVDCIFLDGWDVICSEGHDIYEEHRTQFDFNTCPSYIRKSDKGLI
jgi:hypothetical protein